MVRYKRAYFGTGAAGIICTGIGVAESLFGMISVPTLGEDFMLGFGVALVWGSLLFRSEVKARRTSE